MDRNLKSCGHCLKSLARLGESVWSPSSETVGRRATVTASASLSAGRLGWEVELSTANDMHVTISRRYDRNDKDRSSQGDREIKRRARNAGQRRLAAMPIADNSSQVHWGVLVFHGGYQVPRPLREKKIWCAKTNQPEGLHDGCGVRMFHVARRGNSEGSGTGSGSSNTEAERKASSGTKRLRPKEGTGSTDGSTVEIRESRA